MADPRIAPASPLFPAKVFFYAQDPQALLDAGYDSLRIEKRRSCTTSWARFGVDPSHRCEVRLAPGVVNYFALDPSSEVGFEYRAVLQNSANPGTPPDVPQPVQKAVNVDYEQILTIQELHDIYLWGNDKLFLDDTGITQPLYPFAHFIRFAIAKAQKKLSMYLLPTRLIETTDLRREDFIRRDDYLSIQLENYPVLDVESVSLKIPNCQPYTYPSAWLRTQKATGEIVVVPDGPGAYPAFPFFGPPIIPDAIEITYTAGFDPATFPPDLKELVGKEASFGPFNVIGDLVGGAGIAATSISMDGLSQSVSTTSSATEAGFGARLTQYERELKDAYKVLTAFYKGPRLYVA